MGVRDSQSEQTRERILEVAADEIYRSGFQAASTAAMLKRLGISKGALYHHFENKQALGYAVLDEYLASRCAGMWDGAIHADDPLATIITQLRRMGSELTPESLSFGCPINNLAQEMSPLDEGFRERVGRIYGHWTRSLEAALSRAQSLGLMRESADPSALAALIVATTQGAMGLAKNALEPGVFLKATEAMLAFLQAQQQSAPGTTADASPTPPST
ncbi:MAG: TetR/AcrR family transcriptional regulator [Pseudomonadota bacterium]